MVAGKWTNDRGSVAHEFVSEAKNSIGDEIEMKMLAGENLAAAQD